jgi:alcohol dehydrogenase class IV
MCNILLIVGNSSRKELLIKNFIDEIKHKYKIEKIIKRSINPQFEESYEASKLIQKYKCDVIIAIGGGSIIDTAKLISAFQPYNKLESKKILLGDKFIDKKLTPIIAIPTTAGTGSESTHFAVAYHNNKKFSVSSKRLLPEAYFIDSELTNSMSMYLSASTGFDALTQAIESAWSINSNVKSLNYSHKAIKLIINNIKKSVVEKNVISRNKMCKAANLSGKAINITKTTAPHAMSYSLASKLKISHGHSVAIILGHFFEINCESNNISKKINQKILNRNMKNIFLSLGVKSALAAKKKWFKLMDECNLETSFVELKLTKEKDVNRIISSINIERLENHPVILDKKAFLQIFK